ncbi:FAD/NAD(P)-binding protein [Phytoactinopolyspora limicola]|uniref:FAD/NAD(P)-binding protein n=1 Tax=Phytoactinopolyspora limicola TaxID=2715536 RepID=UPI001A9C6F25|nr:FAD/NAD(P)-binding protein [Phytoactinopolyspora limicola]
MNHVVPRRYRVVDNVEETYDTTTLTLEPIDAAIAAPAPGQFTMLTSFGVGEVPVSVSGDLHEHTSLVHTLRAVGAVTTSLATARPGNVLGVRGPFGTGWDLAAGMGRDLVVIAGGIGLAPLRPVLYAALAAPSSFRRVITLIGARTPRDLLYGRQMSTLSARPRFDVWTTVDHPSPDWCGSVGVVTTLLERVPLDPEHTVAYVCGPEAMMRFAAEALLDRGVPAKQVQVSLERNMRCGAGLCGHCQLGPLLLCRDGPVNTYDQVLSLMTTKEL